MKEKIITNQILKYLKVQPCCFVFKEHGGLYGTSRIPDIICCYRGKFVAFEVRTEQGRLSKLQEITIEKIRQLVALQLKLHLWQK